MKIDSTAEMISRDEYDQTPPVRDGMLDVSVPEPVEYYPVTHRGLSPRKDRKSKPVTVLLAEDRTIVREGICAVLAMEKDINVIGHASDGREAAELTERLHPDVVIINVAMACLNRMQVTRQILHTPPAPRVIILARHGDDAFAKQAARMGAAGYLTEQISAETLANTLRQACEGSYVFCPGISRSVPPNPKVTRQASAKCPLTSRQKQVLQLIAEGNSNKQTASDLAISIKTVEKHRENLMATLDIHDTAGLTRYAISNGIIQCGPISA
jgi:DNA-binding NarL/FixJ family response regulator